MTKLQFASKFVHTLTLGLGTNCVGTFPRVTAPAPDRPTALSQVLMVSFQV